MIVQSLANKKQKDRPGNVYMQSSYACVVLLFHSLHVRKVQNGICKGPVSLQEKKRSKRTYDNFPIISTWGSFQRLKAATFAVRRRIWPILNSFEIFIVDLVIYRNEENATENEGA